MTKFEIILRNNKLQQYQSMAVFIILLNITVFIVRSVYEKEHYARNLALSGAVLAGILLIASFIFRKKKKQVQQLHLLSLLVISVTWAMAGIIPAFLLSLLLMMMYAVSQRKLLVGVDKTAVLYPSFPKRTIEWSELNNLVLKDGLLTIDFKNDKILQAEIIDSSARWDEQEFNNFCREQLR